MKYTITCPTCNTTMEWAPQPVKILARCPLCSAKLARKLQTPVAPLNLFCDFFVLPVKSE